MVIKFFGLSFGLSLEFCIFFLDSLAIKGGETRNVDNLASNSKLEIKYSQ